MLGSYIQRVRGESGDNEKPNSSVQPIIGDQQHATSCEILPCLIFAHFIIYLDSSINSDVKNTVAEVVLVLGISRRTLTLVLVLGLKLNKSFSIYSLLVEVDSSAVVSLVKKVPDYCSPTYLG
ncbi:hypothetical protein MtrunA17_Chr5g0397321 [Medicago truncatula]|uniref:Uncharacterized protein n=1 Tax=Medicago truncatula TaxID=3880 RepID=A0A396HQE8_MEDTR|nr:hypothetical protein MtrunA17_Chr5g0397321 [Medicago truncatula]